jgi:hypothetical protein
MNVPYIINDDTGKVLETPHHDERLPDGTVVGVQVVGGVKRYLSRRPTESGKKIYSALPRFGDVFPIIPKSEWSARIKEKKSVRRASSTNRISRPTTKTDSPVAGGTAQRMRPRPGG